MTDYPGLKLGTGLLPDEQTNSIGRLKCSFGSSLTGTNNFGTGFLVRRLPGKVFLATAAHVIFDDAHGYPGTIDLILGMRGVGFAWNVHIGQQVPRHCFVPADWESGDRDPGLDFGLVRIDNSDGTLDSAYCFDVSSVEPVNSLVRLVGYPKHANAPQADDPYHTHFEAVPGGPDTWDYAHFQHGLGNGSNDPLTYRGMSGGPLIGISTTDTKNRVFGIHTRGNTSDRAVRLTEGVRSQMRNWINVQ